MRLQGVKSNRDGIGARVRLVTPDHPELTQTRWIRAGSGYCSSSEPRAFFGLGAATEIKQIEIRWPDGTVQVMKHVRADQALLVKEGQAPSH